MAQLIKPAAVKVLTKEGEVEVTIAIELTVNLNTDGLNLSPQVINNINPSKSDSNESRVDEKTYWEVPDFDIIPKVDFGKKI